MDRRTGILACVLEKFKLFLVVEIFTQNSHSKVAYRFLLHSIMISSACGVLMVVNGSVFCLEGYLLASVSEFL